MIYDIHAVRRRFEIAPEDETYVLKYLKALKVIIGADGEISDAEWQALVQWMNGRHIPQHLVDRLSEFDFTTTTLEQILPDLSPGSPQARRLICAAIEIAQADGDYAVEEHAAVQRAARLLGIKKDMVAALEGLVEMESAVQKMRKALLDD
ncbi:MAG: TerB family tellurite resistance protein [Candidatus Sericytochromatia bacterium]